LHQKVTGRSREIFKLLKKRGKYYYFYWSCNDESEIPKVEKEYNNAKNAIFSRYYEILNRNY
jgi:hypothetical protein